MIADGFVTIFVFLEGNNMNRFKLSKKELSTFNQDLADCEAIMEDYERAKEAGVPNVEHLQAAAELCKQRIVQLKKAYAPGEK